MSERVKIVYEPDAENFNGVLFLLREPHTDESPEDTLIGNKKWFYLVCDEENRKTRQSARYYNRFCEMLSYVQEENPLHSAFTNLKLTGGGSIASKEYRKISAEEKKSIIDALVDNIDGLQFVFTCSDIFNSLDGFCSSTDNNGIKYKGKKQVQMRRRVYRDITFFEILHPSQSPKIYCDN